MKKTFALLACVVLLSGCATTTPVCIDTVTSVPVEPKASVRIDKPIKPVLLSPMLTEKSSPDDTILAALSDYASLKTYSQKLENIVNSLDNE